MASDNQLHGACACERNQYTILVPAASASLAQVFFDNSAANRRSQATPLTAWLRVPLSWYRSQTFAQFPDETHQSIRRTFHTAAPPRSTAPNGAQATTRRQFCGYCGTHLSAWDEGQKVEGATRAEDAAVGGEEVEREECMDITLGSLLDESLRTLEALGWLEGSDDEDEIASGPTSAEGTGTPDGSARDTAMSNTNTTPESAVQRRGSQAAHSMRNRGMPFFESMVENSRLGRIKRQKGGHTSRDGRTTVEWEVVELDRSGEVEDVGVEEGAGSNKRPRLES